MKPNFIYRAPPHYAAPQLYHRIYYPDYTRNWVFSPQTEQLITLGSLEADSPFNSISPSVAVGDLWIVELVTTPDGLPLTALTDGTASYANPGTRQTWRNKLYDVSAGAFYPTVEDGDYFTIAVGNQAPNEIAPIPDQQAFSNVPYEGPTLDDFVDEPEGDPITYDFALGDALPTGILVQVVTLNSGEPNERTVQRIRGTAAAGQEGTYNIVLRATDSFGAQTTLTAFTFTVEEGALVPIVDDGSFTLSEALEDLADAGFAASDIIPQVNAADVGNVFDQDPEGGTYAPAGSGIVLYVSGIEVPDVVGETIGDATTELTAAGLQVSIQYVRTSSYEADTVISQDPPALAGDPPEQTVVFPDEFVTLQVARAYPISLVKTTTRKRFQ